MLKGKVTLLVERVADRDAKLVAVRRERQRADEPLKARDSQRLAERGTASKAEWGWRTRKKKLLNELEDARGQRGMKHAAPKPVQDASVLEDKASLTQCAVELRTGLQQAATATALLEDSLTRANKDSARPPSSAEALDRLDQPPWKKGATEALTRVTELPRSQGSGTRRGGRR